MSANEQKSRGWFKPTLSFDGVAICIAIIAGSIAWGRVTQKVEQNSEDIKSNRADIAALVKSTSELAGTIKEMQMRPPRFGPPHPEP